MANVRVKETTFGNPMKSIVKFPDHYVNTTVVLPSSAATTVDGRTYIPAGTCLKSISTPAVCALLADTFVGVVFADEDLAVGETEITVTVLIHGFVRKGALVKVAGATPASGSAMILAL